jgi:hypothetical protein
MQQQVQHEPAIKMYVFGGGWTFLSKTWTVMSKEARVSAEACFNAASRLNQNSSGKNGIVWFFYFIGMVSCGLAGMTSYCILVGAMLLFVSFYGFLLTIGASICLAVIGVLRLSNRLHRRIWGINYDCPHPYCYARGLLPVFICSNADCRRRHTQLLPNTFGIWSHRCECGTKLRTLERFGRNKLVRRCATCDNIISKSIGQNTSVHIPMIGGPSSGKTHYIVASTDALISTYTSLYNYRFAFTEPHHESEFRRNIQKLMYGETLAPTPEVAPPAITLKMDVRGVPVPKMLYVYDAAGEAYNSNARTNLQSYYKHICGLIFIVDPCAITLFRLKYEKEIDAIAATLRPCQTEIMQVHDRMMRMLERTRGIRKWGRYRFPIAVVITKVDALGLERVIGTDAANLLMAKDRSYANEGDAINVLVQEFLRQYGLSDLLRNLEYHFSAVRYFSCSVLGYSAGSTGQCNFLPTRILDPLSWLLGKAHVVALSKN